MALDTPTTGAVNPNTDRFRLGFRDTLRILGPYVKKNFMEQINGIWFIVVYLLAFQLLVLQLPILYAGMIAVGIPARNRAPGTG